MSYAPAFAEEVPDPWYTGEFDTVLAMVEAASDGLIAALLLLRGRA
jgi:protein-tyrosine-phosphatase